MNLMPASEDELASLLRLARSVFDRRVLCATLVDYKNILVFAFNSDLPETQVKKLGKQARLREREFGVPLSRVLRNICGVNQCRGGHLIL